MWASHRTSFLNVRVGDDGGLPARHLGLAVADDAAGLNGGVLVGSRVFLRQSQNIDGGLDPVRLDWRPSHSPNAPPARPRERGCAGMADLVREGVLGGEPAAVVDVSAGPAGLHLWGPRSDGKRLGPINGILRESTDNSHKAPLR